MSFFEEVLNDPKAIEEKILGPSYNYTNNIKTPSEMGMSSKGSLSVLAKDIEGIIAYVAPDGGFGTNIPRELNTSNIMNG